MNLLEWNNCSQVSHWETGFAEALLKPIADLVSFSEGEIVDNKNYTFYARNELTNINPWCSFA
jgi:hypothetical protein